MAVKSIKGVSLVLRYKNGSFTYSYIKPGAGSEAIFELGGAMNSLQAEPAKSVNKIVTSHITAE